MTRPEADEPPGRARLGDILLRLGLVDADELAVAVEERRATGGTRRLGRVIRDLGFVTEAGLALALAEQYGLPLVDLDLTQVDADVARSLPRGLAERSGVVAWARRGPRLSIAVADPVDVVTLDDVRALTGCAELDVHVATESRIREALRLAWTENEDSELVRDFLHQVTPAERETDEVDASTDAATIRLVDRLLGQAVRDGASDVHVEPQRDGVRVRMRVDGVLRDAMSLPRSGSSALTARLKIIAELDVIERRLPQDGRALVRVDGERVDLRVSTLPSLHGEKVVVRILPASSRLPSLGALGLTDAQRELLLRVVARPQGLVLLTGPTGSGKTNTLYATIAAGIDAGRNVLTLEDPVEIELPGITQVPVDDRIGLSFARGLRAALRQDPDVILVGEVRDQETAELAVRAALTGHLVLSTLHTLDAASAVTRLVDMGVPAYLVTSSLSLVVSQRLVRIPCRECCVPDDPDDALLRGLGVEDLDGQWLRPVGCPACTGTGYAGRTAVVEMLEIGPAVRRALLDGADEDLVRRIAREAGTTSLLDHAIAVARRGGTTLAEVLRAVPRDHDATPPPD
ncbi:MAG TPA: GspE/PulE family protein [Candidatus Angelobacter sp.]|nr:GspE/PulE family protein [Candidatus Angelobacter sp.]